MRKESQDTHSLCSEKGEDRWLSRGWRLVIVTILLVFWHTRSVLVECVIRTGETGKRGIVPTPIQNWGHTNRIVDLNPSTVEKPKYFKIIVNPSELERILLVRGSQHDKVNSSIFDIRPFLEGQDIPSSLTSTLSRVTQRDTNTLKSWTETNFCKTFR